MSTDQLLRYKKHYEFMLEDMNLDRRHERFIRERLAATIQLLEESQV